jgi:AcrR family transcriptional regulator
MALPASGSACAFICNGLKQATFTHIPSGVVAHGGIIKHMDNRTEKRPPTPAHPSASRPERADADSITLPTSGQRGPVAHDRRAQIITTANDLFREFGYRKTSVAEIGKAMGISTAYVYRFFKSKQAIGEAICAHTLEQMDERLREVVNLDLSPTKRFRLFMRTALTLSYELLVVERQINEVVVEAVDGEWCTVAGHNAQIHSMLAHMIEDGRHKGEFEKKTPLDEVTDGLAELLLPYINPASVSRRSWDDLERGMSAATNLALRSLSV